MLLRKIFFKYSTYTNLHLFTILTTKKSLLYKIKQQLPCFKLLNYTKLKTWSAKKRNNNVPETIDWLSNKSKRVVHLVWNFYKVLFATAAALYTSSFPFNNAIKAGKVRDLESMCTWRCEILQLRCNNLREDTLGLQNCNHIKSWVRRIRCCKWSWNTTKLKHLTRRSWAMGNSLTDVVGFLGYRKINTDQNLWFSSCRVALYVGILCMILNWKMLNFVSLVILSERLWISFILSSSLTPSQGDCLLEAL